MNSFFAAGSFVEHLPAPAVNEVAQLQVPAFLVICASHVYQLFDTMEFGFYLKITAYGHAAGTTSLFLGGNQARVGKFIIL